MEVTRVKKMNLSYLLAYIFGPILLCAFCFLLSYAFFPKGVMAAVLLMGPCLLAFLWWVFGGKLLYNRNCKQMERELEDQGFHFTQTFSGRSCTVMVDPSRGKLALVFFWNPTQHQLVSASHITRTWVDDGCAGAGLMKGSSRVSFLFIVDGIRIRVDTFISNRRWRMDSDYILTGISKADVWVKVLEAARSAAGQVE